MNENSRGAVQKAYAISGDLYDATRTEDPRGHLQTEHDLALVRQLLPERRQGMSVVEVGAGTGRFTTALLQAGFEVLATDVNESLLEKLRQKIDRSPWASNCKVEYNDLFSLSQPSGYADMVVCLHVIPRMRNLEDQHAALLELGRIVKPGGLMIFNYNNSRSPLRKLTAQHTAPPSAIASFLDEAGLDIERQNARWLLTRKLQRALPLVGCRVIAAVDRRLANLPATFAWDVFVAARKRL